MSEIAESIRLEGLVQGVGMRPTVWRLARELDLRGSVQNDGSGVLIRLWGEPARIDRFLPMLTAALPPLARIDRINRSVWAPHQPPADFAIESSAAGDVHTGVAPDAATCSRCLADVLDPADRRHGYPFTNCTHCGPRLSIVRAIPYDRANTSMAGFPLCQRCRSEYENPTNRRFHAQPNACADCGPRVWLEAADGTTVACGNPIETAATLLGQGRIVAIKGIGGFHLACDAMNAEAVEMLRQRKHRDHKPFAMMAPDLDVVRRYASVSAESARLLAGTAAPIVLLPQSGQPLPAAIAPGQSRIGFMLPYSPLHHLLMARLSGPIVLTSGNLSDEPQATDNTQARERLGNIADFLLLHDRDIVNRLDDSVAHIAAGRPRLLRRARGYAPASLPLPAGFESAPEILAMGGELKNTFCLLKDGEAILSQHMGDLEEAATLRDFRHNLKLYADLFQHRPAAIATDLHPDYLSTGDGQALAAEQSLPLIAVQHHHAHLAACMAEHGRPLMAAPVLGVLLDGLGMGEAGELWGGEFLIGDYRRFRRAARLQPVAMPGGSRAIREPWRNAYAHLSAALGWETVRTHYANLAIVQLLESKPLGPLQQAIAKGLNSPPASSAGRLFAAAAACLGLSPERVSYEGQAACELESLAESEFEAQADSGYGHTLSLDGSLWTVGWQPFWQGLLDDLAANADAAVIAARFHLGIAQAVAATAQRICEEQGIITVVLSGGVFQNRWLLEATQRRLAGAGLEALIPEQIPANDGGLALGQVAVAAAKLLAADTLEIEA
ncbi:MAG: carbamoyltransferase HypF [Methylococcaceae bacterium]|nr:carbamoyltransferase HypF [Methylococcaceae bacterium]